MLQLVTRLQLRSNRPHLPIHLLVLRLRIWGCAIRIAEAILKRMFSLAWIISMDFDHGF